MKISTLGSSCFGGTAVGGEQVALVLGAWHCMRAMIFPTYNYYARWMTKGSLKIKGDDTCIRFMHDLPNSLCTRRKDGSESKH